MQQSLRNPSAKEEMASDSREDVDEAYYIFLSDKTHQNQFGEPKEQS